MSFKVNDLVRVKSFKEIKKTLDARGYYHKLYFNPNMERLCSKTFRIGEVWDMKPHRVRIKAVDDSPVPLGDCWVWDVDWLTAVNDTVFSIDVSDLDKAIEEVKRLHYETSKHRLSDEKMKSVKTLMGEYAAKAIEKGYSLVFYVYKNSNRVELRTDFGSSSRTGDLPQKVSAQCSPDDEFNPTVGKFVCLCKLLGHKVPSWI